jgi:hypothetical protein
MKRLLVLILFFGGVYSARGGIYMRDTTKGDTILLSPDSIQPVVLHDNPNSNLLFKLSDTGRTAINSLEELRKMYGQSAFTDPNIDFNSKTLLIFAVEVYGCPRPTIVRQVKTIGNKVIYQLHITIYGGCYSLGKDMNSIAVPKIGANKTVEFQLFESHIQ